MEFRAALGNFASGVTVITAGLGDDLVGMAANSFCSVSLDPPLVSFCAAHSSSTYPRISEAGRFCVNVLASDQGSFAMLFAQLEADRFGGHETTSSPLGSPILGGVLAWLDCVIEQEHLAGDHTIVVGRVLSCAVDLTKEPLLYFRGKIASV
jgi:flavin reductase (DIM6/NTAB) family NADH-FMN oxidoreductase RutF